MSIESNTVEIPAEIPSEIPSEILKDEPAIKQIENKSFWASVVRILHTLFIMFILVAPFLNYELFLSYHFIIVPFLWLHWWTNNDICALTMLESSLTGQKSDHTFMGSLIKPIYNIQNRDFYIATAILFAIVTYRLYNEYNFNLVKLSALQMERIIRSAVDSISSLKN